MVILNLNYLQIKSNEHFIEGGLASASSSVLSNAIGESFAEANTSAITNVSSLLGIHSLSASLGYVSSKAM